MQVKVLTPKQLAWLRLTLLGASLGIAVAQFTPAQAQTGSCCGDCGCDAGFNGCCVLPNGAVCLRA